MLDAIVSGAGPAGALTAYRLASAGLRVRLLDRADFPRDKLCGDTLNPGALAILDRVRGPGHASAVGAIVRARSRRTTGMTVTGPTGARVSADYPPGVYGVAIRRRDLDLLLVEAAVAAGAEFDPGVLVQAPLVSGTPPRVTGVRMRARTSSATSVELHARFVIAADGRASRLASALALARLAWSPRRWAYGAYFEGVDGLTAHGEMHVRGGGYVGVAPLSGTLANVCVVQPPPGASMSGRTPAEILAAPLGSDPALRDRFERAVRVSAVTVLGPLAVDARAAGCPGLLLAGDAAGFVDPMTGDGLRFALRGAELAAEAAIAELATSAPAFETLGAARAREFAAKWRINRALRALVASPRALTAAAVVSRWWEAPVQHLIGVAGDVQSAMQRSDG